MRITDGRQDVTARADGRPAADQPIAEDPARASLYRRTAGVIGLLMAVLSTAWALASPIDSVPDEYMHYKYAYALWSSQVDSDSGEYSIPEPLAVDRHACYSGRLDVTAECSLPEVEAASQDEQTVTRTTANRYPPAFYAVAGWPVRVWSDDAGILIGRVLGGLLCAALTAWAFQRLSRIPQKRAMLGLAFCLSPMVFYFYGSFNPQGLELALSLLLLAAGLSYLTEPTRLDAGVVLAGSVVLALVRPGGFAWPTLILGGLIVAFGRRGRWRRDVGLFGLVVVLSVATAVMWTWLFPVDNNGQTNPGTTLGALLGNTLGRFLEFPREWTGVFGHLDTPVASAVLAAWWVAAGLIILLGLASNRRRVLAAVGLAVLGGILFSLVNEYRVEAGWGYVMLQGRYVLPILFLVLVMLGVASQSVRVEPFSRVLTTAVIIWAVVQTVAFMQVLQRFMIGAGGNPLTEDAGWNPPVPALVLVGTVLAASAGLVWGLRRMILAGSPQPVQIPSTTGVRTPA